ncbi:alpha/beta-hydrolase [Microstroma glucosiphilum]|uniref:Alpha/beta-hydrolase n=1 Tax=Pseudomicrostroma glucosiphilum TaxID=1684307 RepID=A0A316TX69_9BASI|nr:alpha/beta-hydrolase [Pseudomicrostroma glucosiphilum]PWN18039.1 alpha/beta-hydrolase [Pseudomicrostroma glucosiphilum]
MLLILVLPVIPHDNTTHLHQQPSSVDSLLAMTRYASSRKRSLMSLSWSQLACLAFLRLPRIVPRVLLPYTTSPNTPYPHVIRLPSREPGRSIYCWIFLPSEHELAQSTLATSGTGRIPIHVDFHGGGFIMGQLSEQAPFCSMLARRLGAAVITVDYRLGPLDTHPAALHDAEDVVRCCVDETFSVGYTALRSHIAAFYSKTGSRNVQLDSTRLSLSGFSSGGNIALNMLVSCPDWPSPLHPSRHPYDIPALLFFPSVDARQLSHERPRPEGMPASDPSSWMSWLSRHMEDAYLERWQRGETRASPGLAQLSSDVERKQAVDRLIEVEHDEEAEGGSRSMAARRAQASDVIIDLTEDSQSQGSGSAGNELHSLSHCLLVLPTYDTLAHQSGLWLEALERAGRLAAPRDWDGEDGSGSRTHGVTPVYARDMPHGWTQFPDFALSEEQKRSKYDVFDRSVEFVTTVWGGRQES